MNSSHLHTSVATAMALAGQQGWLSERSKDLHSQLEAIAEVRAFAAGEFIYLAGDDPDGVYGLVSGALDISIPRHDGEDLVVHRADPGYWVGDLALFSNSKRLISVRAAMDSQLLFFSEKKLRRLLTENPALIIEFYQLSHYNMKTALELLGNLSIHGAQYRVAFRLLLQDRSTGTENSWISLSHESLATMVATSPLTVRRSLKQLEKSGLIETGYRKMRVIDREGLAKMCGYAPELEQRV